MLIKFDKFGGIAPRYGARQLPMPYAITADNCKMDRGQLRGFAGRTQVFNSVVTIPDLKSMFIYSPSDTDYLFQFDDRVSIVDNINPSDQYKRVYWTNENSPPRMSSFSAAIGAGTHYPSNSFLLARPAPLGEIVVNRVVTPDSPSQEDIDEGIPTPFIRSYTYTYVSQFGEESPPFAPAGGGNLPTVTLYEGDEVSITGMATAPAGDYPFDSLQGAKKRVYQIDVNGSFRMVSEVELTTTDLTFNHMGFDSAPAINQDILIGNTPPDELQGLVFHPSGYVMGYVGNTVYASSRKLFHNFPISNTEVAPYRIQGLVSTRQGVLVVTEGGLYLAAGNDPSNITIIEIDGALGCVSKYSIVDMGEYVLYASQNGIVMGDISGARIVTDDVILENDWPSFSPETMQCYRHLNRYLIISDTHKLVLNPRGEADRLTTFQESINCGFTSRDNAHLVYTTSIVAGTEIYEMDSDKAAPIPYEWHSATYVSNSPTTVGCFKIDADNFDDVTLQVFVGGVPLFSGNGVVLNASDVDKFNNNIMYGRLPSFPAAMDLAVKVTGTSPINSIAFANMFEEFVNE